MSEPLKAVFLSYTSQDAAPAARICEALQAAGIVVWFDQSELRGGDAWDAAIRQQIKSCALFVPVISANAHARVEGYFRLEWKLAVDRSHLIAPDQPFLLPVVIDDTPQTDQRIPDRFRELQWSRLPAGDVPPVFIDRIRRLLSPDAGPGNQRGAARSADATVGGFASRAAASGSQRWVLLIAVLAVLGVAYFALDKFVLSKRAPAAATTTPAPDAIRQKSIAVLPFVDMSEKRDQEYFSDGLSEELIDLLAKTPGLDVIARTSSFYFKNRQATIGEIARTLSVANVIEGSVRKSGNTLRVTAQLIRASDGVNLWSDTYDRDLKDVFMVQDDIARGVVDKLKLALLPAADAGVRTENSDAHTLYLLGRHFLELDTRQDLLKAQDYFEQALSRDPTYASAWAGQGWVAIRRVANGYVDFVPGIAEARASVDKALQLDPNDIQGCAVRGGQYMLTLQWQDAENTLTRCRQLSAFDSYILMQSGTVARQLGRDAESLALYRRSLECDPLNPSMRRYYARVLYHLGRFQEAESEIRHVIELNPRQPGAHYELGRILLAKGDADAALAAFEAEGADTGWRTMGLALGYYAAHRRAEADAVLADMVQHPATRQYQIAETYAYRGDADKAFKFLESSINADPGLVWIRNDPLLKSITHDPRYPAFLREINL